MLTQHTALFYMGLAAVLFYAVYGFIVFMQDAMNVFEMIQEEKYGKVKKG